ncbi:armadillo repeat-containing protein 3-like [Syngnathus acus]|uniref:armadillo repeat-containing protein 3-like n=1 Tax=Syngnathus acus TaxID=161584 RepID=UPI001885AE79|nr:armadillo repeat-containing protein 3-like [Syngnathus acus]
MDTHSKGFKHGELRLNLLLLNWSCVSATLPPSCHASPKIGARQVAFKTPASAVLLLGSQEVDILIKACKAIYEFAEEGDSNKVYLTEKGALGPLSQLITHSNRKIRRNAIIALGVMATNSRLTSHVFRWRNAKRVHTAFGVHAKQSGVKFKKAQKFGGIGCKPILFYDDTKLNLSASFNQPFLTSIINEWFGLISIVSSLKGTAKSALLNIDVIPSIIDRLSLDDIAIHEFGTLCLSALSMESCCQVQIIENNGVPRLVSLLSSADPDVQKNSLETIFNLIQDMQICPAFIELNGIRRLLALLKSVFNVIQLLALKTLQLIAAEEDSQSAFREERVFDDLIEILNNKEIVDLHGETMLVLSNCMSNLESFRMIQKGGGLSLLLEHLLKLPESQAVLQKNGNIEIQAIALKCIASASQNPGIQPYLNEQRIEKILVDLLTGGSDSVKVYGCHAFAFLSSFQPSKVLFRDLGCIPVMVRLLNSKCPVIVEHALQGLANLTSGDQFNTMEIFNAGGPEILVPKLEETCPKVVANSITLLGRMAGQEAIRCEVIEHGVVPALVEPLKWEDTQVLINALLCICELAFEDDARTQLREAEGIEPMVNLLRSSHTEVLRSACMAISVCAKDEPTAMEMCKFGALEILQEISQSVNRRNKFTEFALTSMLKYNVSLKYGLLGYLASTDVITYGFYDTGKVGFCQKVLTLEELCMEPVNQLRPVIFVNAIEMSDEGQQKDEAHPESSQERNRKLMDDMALSLLVKEVKESIEPVNEEQEQYVALARFVTEIMGGAIEKEDLDTFPWLQHLEELRCKLQCNVIPIGMITKGFYCHRALLFKYLADGIGLKCTLVRGEYNRAWNEVLLYKADSCNIENVSQPCCYIVDLMHQPGNFMEADGTAAFEYESL